MKPMLLDVASGAVFLAVAGVYISLLVALAAPIPLLFVHGHPVWAIAYAVAVYAATYLIPSNKVGGSHE